MTTTPAFIQQDLYFGLNIPGSGQLSDAEFQAFLDTVIAPRFIGLTQFDVKGQVKDANGNINKEQSRLVTLITEDTPANKAAINEVRLTYGQEFNGKGSLQVTNADDLTVNFGPAADLFNNSATPKLIEVDAYFGRNIPGDGEVSQLQFQQFIDNVLAPSVPGLTIFNAKGQTASPDGSLTKENSKVVKLIFEDTLANETALNNALKTYQQLFNSAGQLIVANEDVKVSFSPAADLFDNSATPKFIQADLYFGQNIPGIGSISRDVFQEFVDQAIAPLFSGLTQFDARGEVKNTAGTILKEDTQVIRLILQDTLANENAINDVLQAYETQFGAGTLAVFDEDITASFSAPNPTTPIVSVSATPGAVEEGKQLQWNFTLNQPAPVGGLVVEFALTQDTDPLPGDITYNVVGSSNITGFELLRDSAGVITGAKVAIAAGATSATLLNNVIADSLTEGPESITYTLINGTGYAVDGSSKEAKFTILDTSTNPIVSVSATPGAVEEGKQLQWNFTLNQPAPVGGLVVEFALTQDTDPLPGDITYNVVGSSNITGFELLRDSAGVITGAKVAIAAGATSATLLNNVIADGLVEGPESITYTLINGTGYAVDGSSKEAKFTILDTSTNPIVSVSATPGAVEEGKQLQWNFTLNQPAPVGGLVVEFALTQDTDPLPGDITYNVVGSSNITGFELLRDSAGVITGAKVAIAAGATSATLLNNVIADGLVEGPESITYTLINGAGYDVDSNINKASFTLVDNSPYGRVSIVNPSFELPVLPTAAESPDEYFTSTPAGDVIPGWQPYDPNGLITGIPKTPGGIDYTDAYVYNATGFYNSIPDGVNLGSGYVVDAPGSGVVGLEQTLNATVTPNTRYTLVVDVGNPPETELNDGEVDLNGFPGYGIEIYFGDVRWDYTYNPVTITEGKFGQVVLETATPDLADLAKAGVSPDDKITIRLNNRNEGPGIEVDFDNVQLTTAPLESFRVADIQNNSFEDPAVAEGEFTITPPPGWSLYDPNGLVPAVTTNDSSAVGVFNPDKTSYYNEATDGQNVADLFVVAQPGSGPVGLSQTLSEVLTADTRYSFLVDVGNPADFTGFPGYEVELLAGDTVVARDKNSLQIAEGTFSTTKVDFTVGKDNPLLGENLTLRLVNLNQAPGTYLNFDSSALYIEKVKDGSYVYINNPGFETPILADDINTSSSYLVNPVAGWNIYDPTGVIARADTISTTDVLTSIGTWHTPTDAYPNGASQGNNVAYSYIPTYAGATNQVGEGFAGISQTLNTVVAANTQYTLTVDVGNPQSYLSQGDNFSFYYDYDGFPGYRVELLADGEVIGVDNNSLAIAEGKFGTATVSFTAAAGDSILGENLGIRLVNLNTSVGSEVDFDNVQLKAASATVSPITGDQTLFGSTGTTTLNGGQGNDSIYSNGFATSIFGRDGNDTIYGSNKAEYIVGGAGNDTIYGNGGKDTIYGDDGDDLIYGGPDADTIFGGAGNDIIYSNGGNDFINTGVGLDTVWLGGGAATVALDTGVGFDTVNGFQLGASKFQVGSLDGLQFADSANGTQIFQKDDLLAVVSGLSASVFGNNANQIFVV